MHITKRFVMAQFLIGTVLDPEGYKPGRYYFALHLDTMTKVSRYLRSPGAVRRKMLRYQDKWDAGDRWWPEVDRSDELRDSKDAVLTFGERFRLWIMGAL